MNYPRNSERILLAIAMMMCVYAPLNIILFDYLQGMKQATKADSAFDLRGRYMGALDLRLGFDPYDDDSANLPSAGFCRKLKIERPISLYAPLALATYIPLTYLSLVQAKMVFLTAMFLMFIAGFGLTVKLLKNPGFASIALVMFLSLVQVPGLSGFAATTDPLIFLSLTLGFLLIKKDNPFWGGVALAVGCWYKPIVAMVIAGLAAQRSWKALLGSLLGIVVGYGGGVVLFGLDKTLHCLRNYQELDPGDLDSWNNQSLCAVLHRCLPDHNVAVYIWMALSAVILIAAFIATKRHCNNVSAESVSKEDVGEIGVSEEGISNDGTGNGGISSGGTGSGAISKESVLLNLSLWLTAGLIVATRTWQHYSLWLIIPQALLCEYYVTTERWKSIILLAVSAWFLSEYAVDFSQLHPIVDTPTALIFNTGLLGMLLLYGMLLVATGTKKAAPETNNTSS